MMNRHAENNARNSQTLLSRFAEQVRRDPQALAVIDRQVRLTYAQLASASERIAKGLLAQGTGPADPIALCMPRCWQWVATILAVLKVGAVVVPLDRASPARRLQLMLDDGGCVGLVTLGEDADSLAAPQRGWYVSVEALLEFPDQPALPLPEDFAASSFLFYTSGTTGTPKAVDVGGAACCVWPGPTVASTLAQASAWPACPTRRSTPVISNCGRRCSTAVAASSLPTQTCRTHSNWPECWKRSRSIACS